MTIDPILNLPYELIAEILTDWLKIESVVHLDSAYCRRSIRHHFLQMLSWRRFKLFSTTKSKASFILWMIARKIRVARLVCTQALCMAEVSRSVKKEDSTIRKVVLNSLLDSDTTEIGAVLAYHCCNIRILRIIGCKLEIVLQNILAKNRELRELFLSRGRSRERYSAFRENISFDGIKCPKLETVIIEGYLIGVEQYVSILNMSEHLQQFTCSGVDSTSSVASTLHHLRSLSLPTSTMQEPDIVRFARAFPSVTNLSLTDPSDALILTLARSCACIRTLSLQSYYPSMTHLSLQFVASYHAQSLQVLYINQCPIFTTTAVTTLLRKCPNVHTLSVDDADDEENNKLILSSAFMESIHDHPSLRTLLISGTWLNEVTIHALSQHGSNLTTLGIACMHGLEALATVLENCASLRTLYAPRAKPAQVIEWRVVNPKLMIYTGPRVDHVFVYKCTNYPTYMHEVT